MQHLTHSSSVWMFTRTPSRSPIWLMNSVGFYPSEEMEPRFGVTLVNVMRLKQTLVLDSREAPDRHKQGGTQPICLCVHADRRISAGPTVVLSGSFSSDVRKVNVRKPRLQKPPLLTMEAVSTFSVSGAAFRVQLYAVVGPSVSPRTV
jgi:hypothetical protein